jgi:hypothetical protein
MIDERRAARWGKYAGILLMQHYDQNDEVSKLASIVLTLLIDRDERQRCARAIQDSRDMDGTRQ